MSEVKPAARSLEKRVSESNYKMLIRVVKSAVTRARYDLPPDEETIERARLLAVAALVDDLFSGDTERAQHAANRHGLDREDAARLLAHQSRAYAKASKPALVEATLARKQSMAEIRRAEYGAVKLASDYRLLGRQAAATTGKFRHGKGAHQ